MSVHQRRTPFLVLVAVAATFVAACGGGPAPTAGSGGATGRPTGPAATSGGGTTQAPAAEATQPGGGGTVDACALLTADDIKAVTGYTVSRATAAVADLNFPAGCEWELASKEIVPPSIVLGIMTQGGKAYYASYFEPIKNEDGNAPIDGLGDAAIDVGFSAVLVLKGDALFNLQYLGEQDHEVELARKLAAHL